MAEDWQAPDLTAPIARLGAIHDVLLDLRGREAVGTELDRGTLGDAAAQVRVELGVIGAAIDEMGDWGAPTPLLAAAYAVVRENVELAWRAADGDGQDENPHAVLHGLLDAAFHGRRAADGLHHLGDEMVREARRVSREENRQEFMAG
jgi:hypothetical protein